MSAPLFKFGLFGADTSLVVALAIGIGFGFFLERAGFGSARKLVSQFYLNDLAVFKVMFTAIVTAMLGVTYLSWMGVLDLSLVYLSPTYLVPQVVGGLVLGFGFVIGGYCPGTSVAAVATGKIDGIVFFLGVLAGTLLFAEAYPLVKSIHLATPFGPTTIPQYFNLPYGVVVLAVMLMAVGGFAGAAWVEKKMAPRAAAPSPSGRPARPYTGRLAVAAIALAAIAVVARPTPGATARVNTQELAVAVERGDGRIHATELADWIVGGTSGFRLIDLRDEAAFAAYHIPGAENIRVPALTGSGLLRNEKLVLCSTDGSEAAQAWVLMRAAGFRGTHVLAGGLDAWKREVLFPVVKANPTPVEQRENARLTALSAHFGGSPRSADAAAGALTTMPLPTVAPKAIAPVLPAGKKPGAAQKREGC